jgi:hypothetical protein
MVHRASNRSQASRGHLNFPLIRPRIRSMARARLGDSKGTLYNYLKNKEELFDAQVRIWGARGSKMGMP